MFHMFKKLSRDMEYKKKTQIYIVKMKAKIFRMKIMMDRING